ncbi:MAG: hypothetical protein IB618_00915 [Candidatus Pacearchaeota archaeon]|nr:MAG: hypothetical protein IB618_00915 [Candidatus Pacearchaeota archaeon]
MEQNIITPPYEKEYLDITDLEYPDITDFGIPMPSKPYESVELRVLGREKKISLLETFVNIEKRFSGFVWFRENEKNGRKVTLQCVNGYVYDIREESKSVVDDSENGARIYEALEYPIFGYIKKNNKYEGAPKLKPGLHLASVVSKLKKALEFDKL